jgi:hypothetical protein
MGGELNKDELNERIIFVSPSYSETEGMRFSLVSRSRPQEFLHCSFDLQMMNRDVRHVLVSRNGQDVDESQS